MGSVCPEQEKKCYGILCAASGRTKFGLSLVPKGKFLVAFDFAELARQKQSIFGVNYAGADKKLAGVIRRSFIS
jgi:hypothetical protein